MPRAESRYGESLFQLSVLGRTTATMPPIPAASDSRANRPPTSPPRPYLRDAIIGTRRTTIDAATASHAARDRDNTRAAPTSAAPTDPRNAPTGLLAVVVAQTSEGSPITAMCATKLRLPNVPPGARLVLKYSVSSPYACARQNSAAQTVATATATSTERYAPLRAISRDPQNTITLDTPIASEPCATQ